MEFVFFLLLGLSVGSFVNCLIYRLYLRGEICRHLGGVIFGRSFCPKCKQRLAWYDNIPLLSFALLRGKCRYCYSPISWQYPLVELGTGIATLLVLFHLRGVPQAQHHLRGVLFNLLVTYVLIAVFLSDLRYGTIPDEIVLPGIGMVALFYLAGVEVVAGLLAGLGAAAFFLALVLLTHGKGMGLGDVKLASLMGLILGWPKILTALYLAFLTGALTGVILILLRKKRFGQQIPFGPFLAGATWITLLWGERVLAWLKF